MSFNVCSQKEATRRQEEAEKRRQEEAAEHARRSAYIAANRKDQERVNYILEKQASTLLTSSAACLVPRNLIPNALAVFDTPRGQPSPLRHTFIPHFPRLKLSTFVPAG